MKEFVMEFSTFLLLVNAKIKHSMNESKNLIEKHFFRSCQHQNVFIGDDDDGLL